MVTGEKALVHRVLVIGSGVAGLEVARSLAYADYEVCLIEKEPFLGGMVRRLNQLYPEGMPNSHTLDPLVEEVTRLGRVEIMTDTELVSVNGDLGNYQVKLKQGRKAKELAVGALIVATGLKEWDVGSITPYGYGRYERVLTPIEFEEKISNEEIKPEDLKSVVIINCAGSRDKNYLPYCSRVCCFIGLKEAKLIKDKNPDMEVYVCYIDMRSYGSLDSLYNTLKDVYKVNFIQGRPSKVKEKNGNLHVIVEDVVLGETLDIQSDYVVLNHGYVGDEDTLSKLRIPLDSGDKGRFPTTYCNAALSVDSNPRGIFICGCAAYPKNVAETLVEARSAVHSAINALRDISLKTAVPTINSDICAQAKCKLCLSICPYDAIVEEEDKIKIISSMCMGCGICTATCASGANQLEGFSDTELYKEIEEIVEEDDTVAFLCQWSAYPLCEERERGDLKKVKFIKLPCSGRVSAGLIAKVFSYQARNILVAGCYPDACHYNRGNFVARRRIFAMKSLLEQFGISSDRLRIEWIGKQEARKLQKVLKDMRKG